MEKDEKESSFPGGLGQWQRYMLKNLVYPDRAVQSKITGMVVVNFIVDTEGRTSGFEIHKSVEYSLDQESIRLLQKSPRWTPGSQDGTLVKTFKLQPIVYNLE